MTGAEMVKVLAVIHSLAAVASFYYAYLRASDGEGLKGLMWLFLGAANVAFALFWIWAMDPALIS